MAEVAVPVSLMVSPVGQRSKLLKLYPAGPRKDVSAVQTRAERFAQSIDLLHCRTGVSGHGLSGRLVRPLGVLCGGETEILGALVVTTVSAETVGAV